MTLQEENIISVKPKKRCRWLWMIASPFLFFLLLIVLLYLPPVQRFAVDKASAVASESTGLDIRVGRLDLRFPLDLLVTDVSAIEPETNDTLLSLERLKVELRFWKLLKKEIEIEEISLKNVFLDTKDFIDGIAINGHLGELFLESHGVVFSPETARINEFSVKNTDLELTLGDMGDTDTTATDPLYWKILLDEVEFENVGLALKMPQDSLFLRTNLPEARLKDGIVDLKESSYFMKMFSIEQGELAYGMREDIFLESIGLQVDSVYYCDRDIRANIGKFVFKERSGLELVSTEGRIVADDEMINIPRFMMKTTASFLDLQTKIGWDVIEMKQAGVLSARLSAEFGKSDIMKVLGGQDTLFLKTYPDKPLRIHADAVGNLDRLQLQDLSAELAGSFGLMAEGDLLHLTDSTRRGGEINFSAESYDMRFLRSIMDGRLAIRKGTALSGIFTMSGNRMGLDFLLKQPEARAKTLVDSVRLTVHNDTLSLTEDFQMRRAARIYAQYDMGKDAYWADLVVNDLDMRQFLPKDSIFDVKMNLHVDGEGLDFFAAETHFNLQGTVDKLHYINYRLAGYDLMSTLENHQLDAVLKARNSAMEVDMHLDAKLKPNDVAAHLSMMVPKLDWQVMQLIETPLSTSHKLDVTFVSDLMQKYEMNASLINTQVKTVKKSFSTKDLHLGFATSVDSTKAFMRAGDLDIHFEGQDYVETLMQQLDAFIERAGEQWTTRTIDQEELKALLPGICLKAVAGSDNPFSNYLEMAQGISFDKFHMDLDTSPVEGLNGEAYLYNIRTDSLEMDTISIDLKHGVDGLDFFTGVISTPKPNQEAFEIDLDGNIGNGRAQFLLQYLNAQKEKGIYLGVNAALGRRGIRMKLFPENPTLVYRPFKLNERNYIYLADRGRIFGDVRLYDEQGTGIHFYTNREDTIADQEMTIELSRIGLQQFKRVIPYMPDMDGWLGGSVHYVDSEGQMMLSADVNLDDFMYEGSPLGNWAMSGVYLPGDSSRHHVDGYIQHNNQEIVYLNGIYQGDALGHENITGDLELHHFPLTVINPFIPDKVVRFRGDIDGTLSMTGSPMKPILNGSLKLDSVLMAMPDMSVGFRFDDKQVKMENSRMIFDRFNIYTRGENPFVVNGSVDFSNMEDMMLDLRMKTNDYELMNAPKNRRATTYGKIYVDVDATLKGPVDELKMRGNMNVLGKTDFTYVLKDSPLMVNDRLGDMVEFVNFNDTVTVEETVQPIATLTGMDIAMTVHIDQAVQAHVDLTADGSNYMEVEGGGDLAFQYTPQGEMLLNGRYSVISGELKYEIPIIPLKTFHIQNGSFLNWTGNMMNPEMNIKATERIRANVGSEGEASRMVSFDVGILLTERLETLGLAFTLEAPEDASVQEQLNAMSVEERGKLAVTMLVTGMYMADGNSTGGFNVNNALNSFLQNQISNVVGQSMDISLGMESTSDAEGGRGTDYNFQFAKRFWNNRFRIVIGGTVSTGNTAQKNETFIDNIAIEYRLDDSGTRYVKLFHETNYESVLEGEVIETGVGVVLRKKVSKLGELFIFKKKKDDDE